MCGYSFRVANCLLSPCACILDYVLYGDKQGYYDNNKYCYFVDGF